MGQPGWRPARNIGYGCRAPQAEDLRLILSIEIAAQLRRPLAYPCRRRVLSQLLVERRRLAEQLAALIRVALMSQQERSQCLKRG